jgi:hypothetical protein
MILEIKSYFDYSYNTRKNERTTGLYYIENRIRTKQEKRI